MKDNLRGICTFVIGVVFAVSAVALPANVDQPHMQAALDDLKDAQNYLRQATADKGGHRQRAMDFTAGAINAVQKGIDYDRTHFTPRPRRNSTDAELGMSLADQPNMVKARQELQDALASLRRASADKGGFRNQAIAMANNAINSVNAGIEYDRRH